MKIFLLALLAFIPLTALAQEIPAEEEIPRARNHVITSLQKCLDKLDAADVAEIRRSYVKPYQECQKRVQEKEAKAKTAAVQEAEEKETPVTPRNFVRVKKPQQATPEKTADQEKNGKKD